MPGSPSSSSVVPHPLGNTVCLVNLLAVTRSAKVFSLLTTSSWIAIQIAKLAGFSPIIATASPHNTSLLTSLSATHVIDRSLSDEDILAKLPELTGGEPIELVYDAISLPETMPLAYQALAPGGGLVIVLADVIPAELKKEGDGKRIAYVFGNVHSPENRACGVEMYKRLTEWLEKGIIKVPYYCLPEAVRRSTSSHHITAQRSGGAPERTCRGS